MGVDQNRPAESKAGLVNQRRQGFMIGSPQRIYTRLGLALRDRTAVDRAPLRNDAWNDPQSGHDARVQLARGQPLDHQRVHILGRAVKIDDTARNARCQHDRAVTCGGTDQPVNESIFGTTQLLAAQPRLRQEPLGIVVT